MPVEFFAGEYLKINEGGRSNTKQLSKITFKLFYFNFFDQKQKFEKDFQFKI